MEKQRTVMPVTKTFMVKRALEITGLSAVKRKTQFVNHCIAVKDCGAEFNPKSQHKCGYSKCVTCKKYLPNDHECFMQSYKFLDEIAYDNAGQDEELIGKADALYKQRLQKSRYIVWDIETFALNQRSGKGRQVPHLLIAATTCYNYLNRPFNKQVCDTCGGHHKIREYISNEAWKIDNTHVKFQSIIKHLPSAMVWGCFLTKGRGGLYFMEKGATVNGQRYRQLLEDHLLSFMEIHECNIFQQDSALCRKSTIMMKWFNDQNVDVLKWPGNSLDLNPVKSLWTEIKQMVTICTLQNLSQLKCIVKDV